MIEFIIAAALVLAIVAVVLVISIKSSASFEKSSNSSDHGFGKIFGS
jgi:hypothetical protein